MLIRFSRCGGFDLQMLHSCLRHWARLQASRAPLGFPASISYSPRLISDTGVFTSSLSNRPFCCLTAHNAGLPPQSSSTLSRLTATSSSPHSSVTPPSSAFHHASLLPPNSAQNNLCVWKSNWQTRTLSARLSRSSSLSRFPSHLERSFSRSSRVASSKRPTESAAQSPASQERCQVFDQSDLLVGRMTVAAAEDRARNEGLKLLDIGTNDDGLRCFRMMTGKQLMEETKKHRAQNKGRQVKDKEIRVFTNIGDQDLHTKINQARQFLAKDMTVKIVIRFKKLAKEDEREDSSSKLVRRITAQLQDVAELKQGIKSPKEQQLVLRPLPKPQEPQL